MWRLFETRLRPASRSYRRWVLRFAIIAGAGVVLLVAARPTYHTFKEWRSRSLAKRAEFSLAGNDLTNAARHAQAAYLMRPNEPSALRAAAKVQTSIGHPNAVEFWQGLIESGDATVEDRRTYVEACLRVRALDRANAELQKLVHEAPSDPANLWLLSQLSLAQGKLDESLEFARQAKHKDPEKKQYRLFVASIEYNSFDAEPRKAAHQEMKTLAEDQTSIGLEAAVFLARQNDLSKQEEQSLIEILEKHPLSKTVHKLFALELKTRTAPQLKADLLAAAIKQYQAAPVEDLALFAAWLNEQREFNDTLRAIPLDQALKQRELFMLHMDAVAGLERWKEVQEILNKSELPIAEAYVEAFRARTASKLKDEAAAVAAWRRALQAASGTAEELAFLAQYAEKNGEYDQAKRAYRALVSVQPALPVYLSWSRLVQQYGTTEELRDLLKDMAERWPDELSFRNDLAYLDLLLKRNVDASRETAQVLAQSSPQSLPVVSTLALAWLRSDKPAEALKAFGGRDWEWEKALPSNRAVYIATLVANGKTKEAKEMAQGLPSETLRTEEKDLLHSQLQLK